MHIKQVIQNADAVCAKIKTLVQGHPKLDAIAAEVNKDPEAIRLFSNDITMRDLSAGNYLVFVKLCHQTTFHPRFQIGVEISIWAPTWALGGLVYFSVLRTKWMCKPEFEDVLGLSKVVEYLNGDTL